MLLLYIRLNKKPRSLSDQRFQQQFPSFRKSNSQTIHHQDSIEAQGKALEELRHSEANYRLDRRLFL